MKLKKIDRGALLDEIKIGKDLKHTETVDRSSIILNTEGGRLLIFGNWYTGPVILKKIDRNDLLDSIQQGTNKNDQSEDM